MQSQDQLLLKVGAPVGVPPTGNIVVFADTDGSVKALGSTGAKSSFGGSSGSAFEIRMRTLAASLASFTGERKITLGAYPAGVAIASRTNNQTQMTGPGIAATATPLALSNNFLLNPKIVPWFAAYRGIVTGSFTGTNYGLFTVHDGTNDFVRFGYAGGDSNSFWRLDVGHGGATTLQTSATALDNNVHDHAVFYDGSAAVKYYLDSVLIATISVLTNFPTTAQSLAVMATGTALTSTEAYIAFNET